jgi:hypothetical protein
MELLTQITDDRFDLEKLDQYELHIEIQPTRFKFYLVEASHKTVFWLEDYASKSDYNPIVFSEKVINLINNHIFLKASFWKKITLTFDSPIYTKVVESFFEESRLNDYLSISFPDVNSLDFKTLFEKAGNDFLIYAVPLKLFSFFETNYCSNPPQVQNKIIKIYRSFLKYSNYNHINWIIIGDKWIDIYFRNTATNQIIYKNFPLTTKNLNAGLDTLIKNGGMKTQIWGEITPYSKIYARIKSKIKTTEIGELNTNKKFTVLFEDLPSQRHFSLFL